jgi:hypothetical protein
LYTNGIFEKHLSAVCGLQPPRRSCVTRQFELEKPAWTGVQAAISRIRQGISR